MALIYLKYYFRNGFFFRFTPFLIPTIYYSNVKIELLLYVLIFILFENAFCKPNNEKYLWDNRINVITDVNTGKLLATINIINAVYIVLWFCVSLFIRVLLDNNIVNVGYLIIQFSCLLISSTIIGNFLYFTFSKIPSFFFKRVVRIITFGLLLNIPVMIFLVHYYFQIIFLLILVIFWLKQVEYFKSQS